MNGVSEGQIIQVFKKEIPQVEKVLPILWLAMLGVFILLGTGLINQNFVFQAWKALYNKKPLITFQVVQKRHHTRLITCDRKYQEKIWNVLLGHFTKHNGEMTDLDKMGFLTSFGKVPDVVVDRQIRYSTEFDFFLCKHARIIWRSLGAFLGIELCPNNIWQCLPRFAKFYKIGLAAWAIWNCHNRAALNSRGQKLIR